MSKSMFGAMPRNAADSRRDWATDLAPYGERRLKVIWDISNKCNLRCRMCHFSFDHVFHQTANFTSPVLFERIATQALPIAHTLILSAGNEPLISPHFVDILKIAARYRVPELLFLTNGQLLTPKIAEAVLDAGVTQVQISIDGATKETYEYIRRGAHFDRLVRNLKYLTARKRELARSSPRLQFNIVLMQKNLEELPLFVDLAEELGVEWIAARHLLIMNGLAMEQETLEQDPARANFHFRSFFRRVEESKTVTVIGFPDLFHGEEVIAETEVMEFEAERSVAPQIDELRQIDEMAEAARKPHKLPADATLKARRSVMEKVGREICRVPRNIRRSLRHRGAGVPACSDKKKLAALPFGAVDRPAQGDTHANNAIEVEGWALDRKQVVRVTIEREPFATDSVLNARGFIALGEARILNGSRPDVGVVFPLYPHTYRAGWSFELRREMISAEETFDTVIHAIAHTADGRNADIGHRSIAFSRAQSAKPYLFCSKPFDSLFIDSKGDVRPYPDCRPERPFGSLAKDGSSLQNIWWGQDFRDLRHRIINRDPPPMCLTCAYFINRNVDDSRYFLPR